MPFLVIIIRVTKLTAFYCHTCYFGSVHCFCELQIQTNGTQPNIRWSENVKPTAIGTCLSLSSNSCPYTIPPIHLADKAYFLHFFTMPSHIIKAIIINNNDE